MQTQIQTTYFYKMKKFFYFLLALPLVFAACENTEEPKPEVKDPVLNVTETTLDFVAEGAEGTIHYSVENAVEGTEVEATCAAEWVTNLTVAENITFVVEANDGEARETSIVVAYGDLQKSVAVKQAGAEAPVTVVGWGIVGTMNDWNATKPMLMEESGDYFVLAGVELTTEDKFKFIKDGDNAYNRGGNGQAAEPNYFYKAQSWGSDIYVSEAGTYDIYLNKKEDTYYIMSEGKSPAEALEPLAPGEDLWEVYGNFEGEKVRLTTDRKYMVAKGVKFSSTVAEFDIRINEGEKVFGAKSDAVNEVEEQIALSEASDIKAKANVEAGVAYDIYYRSDMSSAWVMPEGTKPLVWKEVTGIAFSATNFALFLIADGIELLLDFNCGVNAVDSIIPEGTYYVNNENDGGFNFNFGNEYDMRIDGVKTKLKDGTMVIKHISGGYDITVDMESIHNHKVNVHYAGPVGEVNMMGRPITNPE